jgi:aminopeptidase YwaD
MIEELLKISNSYLDKLCNVIKERPVGSVGNREAAAFIEAEMARLGWETETPEFEALDWYNGGAVLVAGSETFDVLASPYSLGYSGEAELVSVTTADELSKTDTAGKILFLHGKIAAEQLMPKNFVFFNPDEHKKIIALLEQSGARAIICATGRNAALAGGVYPFPLIEDGDFDIPSVYMTEEEGKKLLPFTGKKVMLKSDSQRIKSKGCNVIGRKGDIAADKIVVTAHMDAKIGTPGALDNATGVIVLLLLARLLGDYTGDLQIELVAFNGEDYYSVPGQMNYIAVNQDSFNQIMLNINIDGAGYKDGPSALSFYGLPSIIESKAREVLASSKGVIEGRQWPQGDHSIFIQYGRPALAATSQWFAENIDSQTITHTPEDKPEIVDCQKLIELAETLNNLIRKLYIVVDDRKTLVSNQT